jgi:hypothetical protein
MSRMPRASPTQPFIWPLSSAVYAPLLSLELGLLLFHAIVWHLSKAPRSQLGSSFLPSIKTAFFDEPEIMSHY